MSRGKNLIITFMFHYPVKRWTKIVEYKNIFVLKRTKQEIKKQKYINC